MRAHNETIMQLANELKQHFPNRLQQILLFGSQARGEAGAESDYDCLLIFDQVTPAVKAELDQLTGRYLLERGWVLSCIPLSEAEWARLQWEPFVINARKEGVLL